MNKLKFFQPPTYNHLGRNQLWIDACLLSHDAWCGCDKAALHFINAVIPEGHKDRDLTINEIIAREIQSTCHSGGDAGTSGGAEQDLDTDIGPTNEELERIFTDDAIEELLTAAANDEEPR